MAASSSALGSARLGPIVSRPVPSSSPPASFGQLATEPQVERTVRALESNGFRVVVVPDRTAARSAVLSLVPEGSEVFPATSKTIEATGVLDDLSDPKRFANLRPRMMQLFREGKRDAMRRLAAAPDYVVGSVHAVTEEGQVVIASATGSQLGPYASGAGHVIWVVGTQKIVPDLEAAVRRIQEYAFPREDARAREVYGQGSVLGKLLVVGNEVVPGRITVVLVKENLGF